MKKKLLFAVCFFVFVCFCFSSVSLADDLITCYHFWGKSGTQSFAIHPGESEVTFQPWVAGRWYFKAYHTFLLAPNSYVHVYTYWKDASNPNDTWHYWPGGGLAYFYYFIPYRTLLYSGSPSITYKFFFQNYNDFGVTININLVKI